MMMFEPLWIAAHVLPTGHCRPGGYQPNHIPSAVVVAGDMNSERHVPPGPFRSIHQYVHQDPNPARRYSCLLQILATTRPCASSVVVSKRYAPVTGWMRTVSPVLPTLSFAKSTRCASPRPGSVLNFRLSAYSPSA